MESVSDFKTLRRLTGLEVRVPLRERIETSGLFIPIVTVTFEVVAAIRAHSISQQILAGLNQAIAAPPTREKILIATVESLHIANSRLQSQVADQDNALRSLDDRSAVFANAAATLKHRQDTAIMSLHDNEARLKAARRDALGSAEKAADAFAADTAAKASAETTATLLAQREMQGLIHESVTPRKLTPLQSTQSSDGLKSYAPTPFDMSVNNDPDSTHILEQIGAALEKAGWTSTDAPSICSLVWPIDGKPQVDMLVAQGIPMEILESSKEKLEALTSHGDGVTKCRSEGNRGIDLTSEASGWPFKFYYTRVYRGEIGATSLAPI